MESGKHFDLPVENVAASVEMVEGALEAPAELEEGEKTAPPVSPFQASLRRFRRDKPAMVSLYILLAILFISIVLPPIYQHIGQPLREEVVPGYVLMHPSTQYHSAEYLDANRLKQYPSAQHWLGTDDNGQDILARLLRGWQVSLLVVIAIEIQDVLFGVFFGVLAGYFGGIIDTVLARFTDLMFAFPGLLLAILVVAIFGPQFDSMVLFGFDFGPYGRVFLACLVLGFLIWPQMARFVRGRTLQLKEQEFIEAARASGASSLKIIMRHILPNLGSLIIVATSLNLAGNLGADGALSFLGLGVQPPGSGLGLMIAQYAPYLQAFGYEIIWPMLAIVVLVLACCFIGGGLESAFDPRDVDAKL
ncbi:MAG TPA: ABC transporter permease [Ktedonobacterales bacterium]|jgi:peptide/nickel transport system permease protein